MTRIQRTGECEQFFLLFAAQRSMRALRRATPATAHAQGVLVRYSKTCAVDLNEIECVLVTVDLVPHFRGVQVHVLVEVKGSRWMQVVAQVRVHEGPGEVPCLQKKLLGPRRRERVTQVTPAANVFHQLHGQMVNLLAPSVDERSSND